MTDRQTILFDVREMLVDVLGVTPEEVVPEASFFDDLGGESIDVLDLSFRCTSRYGMTIPFQDLMQFTNIKTGSQGEHAGNAAAHIAEQFPYLTVSADLQLMKQNQLQSLFTVDTIVQIIEYSLNRKCES